MAIPNNNPGDTKQEFKAESKRLLELMIHSIYTHKEIFLRELISNASDAVDKLCYLSLTDSAVGLSRSDFHIDITPDKENRLLTIADNGIGMTREELEANLGTIAKSGSLQFKQDMSAQEDVADKAGDTIDIIGQFGVGFYSAFMVADKVTVRTRAYGSQEAWEWQSTGADGYTITSCDKEAVGSEIIMEIKADGEDEDYSQFLEDYSLSSLVKKYSDYVRYPIRMEREKQRPIADENPDSTEAPQYEAYREIDTLNSMVPIWQRNRSEVTDEEYTSFYQEKFHDYEEPLLRAHVDAEGVVSYKALLFVPAKASYDFFSKDYQKGLQLYSSGVMIMEKCSDLVPEHFRFVQGVVDSPDLSLNISRELLQHDRQLKTMAANIERRIKNDLLRLLSNEREKYEKFWSAFGPQMKYGVVADFGMHKDNLKDLLLFASSGSDKLTSLAEYVARMKDGQTDIYYATGASAQRIGQLPQLEQVQARGYEVLYCTEDVDEFTLQTLQTYMEKPFKSINSGDLGLATEEEKKATEQKETENKELLAFVKEALGDKVTDVKLSQVLVSHPVCLTAGGYLSFEMEKYINSVQSEGGAKAERILELNPSHEIFAKLADLYAADKERAGQYAQVLYAQSVLMAGLPLDDPSAYSQLLWDLL